MRPVKRYVLWFVCAIGCTTIVADSLPAQSSIQFQPRGASTGTSPKGNSPKGQATPRGASGNANTSVSEDLLAIYRQTQAASQEAEITAIARACAKVIPDTARSRVDRDYAANLFAWALNRRGEMRNEQAAQLVEQGQMDQASHLDLQAAKDFETAIQYNPHSWRTHHNLGISLAMKGDYVRAVKEFSAAIDLKDDYPNSHFNRAELYFELAQYPQAIEGYTQAIALSQSDPQYYNSRGHCRFLLEQYDEALQDYVRATELGTDSAVYATDLADAYQYLGRWEEAAQAYRTAVAINSKYPRAYQNAAWLMATCPDPKIRNVDLALSAAKKVIELTGQRTPQALDTLAAASAAVGKHGEAVSLQQEALRGAEQQEQLEMSQRLSLYQRGQSFLQPSATTNMAQRNQASSSRIRTASGISRQPQ
jgi:tetratricopeptide (TPR) repeat protein